MSDQQALAPESPFAFPLSLDVPRRLLHGARENGAFAGAVALVAQRGRILLHEATGYASLEPVESTDLDTIFDLASLTKVVCTTTLILQLIDRGQLALDDSIGLVIPEWLEGEDPAERARVTVRQLLTHSAGLPGWFPLYTEARNPAQTLSLICRLGLASPPGTRVEYSDLGFILLGLIVERLAGLPLDICFQRAVAEPLRLQRCGFRLKRGSFAATERGNRYEMAMVARGGLEYTGWRDPDRITRGEVNDGNSHYAMNGVSGHAGLFGTAADLFHWSQLWLRQGGGLLSSAAVDAATTTQTADLNQARGLGWATRRPVDASPPAQPSSPPQLDRFAPPANPLAPATSPLSGGDWLSSRAFGHTGFTGTSIWIDPARDLIIILLTNCTHPVADHSRLRLFRPRFHNAVVAACP